jgi:nucleoside-diphosphate-sugar epimerase
MIAVVTGASGFIGRNLVGRLRDDGHEVRCLVRNAGGAPPPGVTQCAIDYDDPASIARSSALDGADVVFHLAGATRARSSAEFERANVMPTRSILAALVSRGLSPRFVHVSSQAAAGPASSNQRPIAEDDEPKPVEEYGRSKLLAERAVEASRVPWTIVRPCSVYGRFDRDFLRLFQLARRGMLVYPGVQHHWLSLLHVDDVVDGLVAAALGKASERRVYFLAAKSPIQWGDLGKTIARAAGRPVSHINVPGSLIRALAHIGDLVAGFTVEAPLLNSNKAALSRHPYWVCNSARAEAELGWHPSRSLPDGVRDTYLWYDQSGWLSGSSRAAVAVA